MRKEDVSLRCQEIRGEEAAPLIGRVVMVRKQNGRTVEGKVKEVNSGGRGSCTVVTENGKEVTVDMEDIMTMGSVGKKGERPGREQEGKDDGKSVFEEVFGMCKIPAA